MAFLRDNMRWLGVGLLLTFFSSFGQTWFISLFADFIKEQHGLTDGSWGSLYTVATLSSAALLLWRGSVADSIPLSKLAPAMALIFALAAVGMALGQSAWLLVIVLFLLRFCGQGMFSHIAMTAMGRWFEQRRGRAVAIANFGHPAGEVVLSILTVAAIAVIGWRTTWIVVALILAFALAPALRVLLSGDRAPQGSATGAQAQRPGLHGRHWSRADAARHWLLPALLPILLTPGFVSTVIYFHQAHVASVKGWTLAEMAPGYTAYGVATVAAAFAGGWAADRFGAQRLLPVLLVPMAIGAALIGPAESVVFWYLALGFTGLTQGIAGSLWGVLFPVLYGTAHLGAIRSLATTIMVVSTAIGPGITGVLIDMGVDFPTQSIWMALWCIAVTLLCVVISRRVSAELARDQDV